MTDNTTPHKDEQESFPPSISTLDAAKRLGVTVPTIQRWLDQGILDGWKTPGGHRRIQLSSVQAYIDSRMDRHSSVAQEGPDILIIEDDPIYLEFLQEEVKELLPHGRVRVAHDGFEGLAEVATQVPSCVITDIRMPHMDGVEMIRYLLLRHTALAGHVLVVSGGEGSELMALGAMRPSVVFLPKSTQVDVLRATIEQLLSS